MNNENWEDNETKTVRELRDKGDLFASFFLCSALIEHYCKTKLLIHLTDIRPMEIREVVDKRTKKTKKAFIWSDLKNIIWKTGLSQRRIMEIGFLVNAWDFKLWKQLKKFNRKRNNLVHKHERLLEILKEDEKEVRDIIDLGLSLLHNIKLGYVKS
ncbi:MAG: hypothetical protein V3V81_03145 [Candidatus Bathyarchaeia archaeon]|jgi:hypothetical protein